LKSLFYTNSTIGYGSGGGVVTYHIRQALRELPSDVEWFDGKGEEGFFCEGLGKFDLAVFYGAPFGLVAEKVQPAKIVSDVAPHNIELSREEHHRLGLPFAYPHLNDYNLWREYMKHVILADLVIVHSHFSGQYLRENLKLENRVEVISHGCDLPEKIAPYPEEFTVGHLGVNGPDKGQIYLIRAWKLLQEKIRKRLYVPPTISFPNPQWFEFEQGSLILAGSGTEALGGLGYVKDAIEIYKQCTIYVQPTVTEGFGIPVFEAMANTRPVIVTDGAGSSEWIEDGKDGFVVPIRSPEALADKIQYFHGNPSEVKRMGANARKKAEKYTWDKIRKEYVRLFESC